MNQLFKEFNSVSKKEWLAKVEKDLKGKPIDAFNWEPIEGIPLTPFAHADDHKESYIPLVGKQQTNSWEIGIKIKVGQIKLANQEALSALENGATAICFDLKKSPTEEELKILFKGIQLEWISTHFNFNQPAWKRFVGYFVEYLSSKKYDVNKVACSFTLKGNPLHNAEDIAILANYKEELPPARFLTINALSNYTGLPGTVTEIAQLLQAGNEQLVALNKAGLALKEFQSTIQFAITFGDSYFLNIAKIRAIKILWQQILQAWNKDLTAKAIIEVHLSKATQTDDENYNKIRATSQAMAAVIGGAKRLYIYPADAFKNGEGSPFEQRIAMNIQQLLQLESYMDRVIDPAAGSYYIEELTDKLAAAVWEQFQKSDVRS